MLTIKSFTFGPFQENTYIAFDETGKGIVIDPGCYQQEEQQQLVQFITDNNIRITRVIDTHCHIDHVLGNEFIKFTYGVPLAIPEGEKEILEAVKAYAPVYGFPTYQEAKVDQLLSATDLIKFGNTSLEVLYVPGHSPGHLAFYHKESQSCLGGDVLFQGSIGRTDLPGGNHQQLIKSIHEKMFSLPDQVTVFCGHGPTTTIGQEKRTNPFCAIQ